MQTINEYARAEGLRALEGHVLTENSTMLVMWREVGFRVKVDAGDPRLFEVKLSLLQAP